MKSSYLMLTLICMTTLAIGDSDKPYNCSLQVKSLFRTASQADGLAYLSHEEMVTAIGSSDLFDHTKTLIEENKKIYYLFDNCEMHVFSEPGKIPLIQMFKPDGTWDLISK